MLTFTSREVFSMYVGSRPENFVLLTQSNYKSFGILSFTWTGFNFNVSDVLNNTLMLHILSTHLYKTTTLVFHDVGVNFHLRLL